MHHLVVETQTRQHSLSFGLNCVSAQLFETALKITIFFQQMTLIFSLSEAELFSYFD